MTDVIERATIDDVIREIGCADGCSRAHGGTGPIGDGFYQFDHLGDVVTIVAPEGGVRWTEAAYRRRRAIVMAGQIGLGL